MYSIVEKELEKHIVGQKEILRKIFIAILSNGHILIEGVPGLAKTKIISTFGKILGLSFKRIQFTPDMLPSDIVGTKIFDFQTKEFSTHLGPIFNNFILADEINRSPPKVQSALLEAMQERQVTILGETFKLPNVFFVMATQNPIEQYGTYELPEAELDRFLMKLEIKYPNREEEIAILDLKEEKIKSVLRERDILKMQKEVKNVYVSKEIKEYVVDVVRESRRQPELEWGASPRAAISLISCAKANAYLEGRDFVVVDDVLYVVKDVLRHRLIKSFEYEGISIDEIIDKIVKKIPLP